MTSQPIEKAYPRLRQITLLLGSTMTVMAGATIAPALPQMHTAFVTTPHIDLLVKLLLSVHALFIAISAPFAGWLMDRWGRKPVLIGAVVLYGLAGSSGFYCDSLYAIFVGRAFLGIAVAGIMSGFTTLIGDYYSGDRLHRIMGLQAAFTGFGGLVFLTAGGVLADLGWRYPFLIYLFAFIVLPGVLVYLYEPVGKKDIRGAHQSSDILDKNSPLRLLVFIYALAFTGMLVFYMIPVQLPFYLESMGSISSTRVGIAIGIMTLVGALTSTQFKKIKARLSHTRIYVVFALLMGFGYLGLSLANSYPVVIAAMIVSGLGFGLLMPNVNVWTVSLVPPSIRGKAVGGLTTFFLLGQFVSPLLFEPLVRTIGIGLSFGVAGSVLLVLAATLSAVSFERFA